MLYSQAEKFNQQQSPQGKGKKKMMFGKRRQTAAQDSKRSSFKGDDPFNKILYADKSRDTISNMDASLSSKPGVQKSMISLPSQGSGIQKSPSGHQRGSLIEKSLEVAGDRRDAIEPYKHGKSPRANTRQDQGPNKYVHKINSVQGFTKLSQASISKQNSEGNASFKSSVKSNKRSPNRLPSKSRKKTEALPAQTDIMRIDEDFRNHYHTANQKSRAPRRTSVDKADTLDVLAQQPKEKKSYNYQQLMNNRAASPMGNQMTPGTKKDFRISTSKQGNIISQDDDGMVTTQPFGKSVNQMYRNKSPDIYSRTPYDYQFPDSKGDPNAQRYRGNTINPKFKGSMQSQETEKREQNLNVGQARLQKHYMDSFGYPEASDKSPQSYEPVEIAHVKEPKYNDLEAVNLKSKLKLKAGYYEGQDMDMYNKSKQKPPLPQTTDVGGQPRNQRMPGNHQSPSNNSRQPINYDSKNIVLEGSHGQEMEFDEDSGQEDNGNVDSADDQGPKKSISTPPSKKWTITKKTEQTNVSPDEYRDQVNSIRSPSWQEKSQGDSENQAAQGRKKIPQQNQESLSQQSSVKVLGGKERNPKTKRQLLKVRSNSSNFSLKKEMTHQDSRALDDPQESFDYFYKIIVIGDESVGKTNFMLRITKGFFEKKPKTTYGVEFEFRTVPLPNSNQRVRAQIWDTSGAKQFLSITTIHYRFAVGAFLIYDITNEQSFNNLKEWLEKIREYSDEHVQIALVGNKKDLVEDRSQISENQKKMRAELFKDIINDSDNDDDDDVKKRPKKKEQKRITPNYKIESIQYDGGSRSQQYEGGEDEYSNNYLHMYHTRQEKGGRKFGQKNARSPQQKASFSSKQDMLTQYKQMFTQQTTANKNSPTRMYGQKAKRTGGQGTFQKRGKSIQPYYEQQQPMHDMYGQQVPMIHQQEEQVLRQNIGNQAHVYGGKPKIKAAGLEASITEDEQTFHAHDSIINQQNRAANRDQQLPSPAKLANKNFKKQNNADLMAMNISGLQGKSSRLVTNTYSSRTHDASSASIPVKIERQVTEEEAKEFARKNNLLWLGETSCYDNVNNCNEIFRELLKKIHKTQTDLVRKGIKHIDDLRYGEEERNVKYDRCCY